jgi:hypothetical protein
LFREFIKMQLTPKQQFTGEKIDECLDIVRSLGKAGTFHRLSMSYYSSRKHVRERIHAGEIISLKSRNVIKAMHVDFMRTASPISSIEFHFAPQPEYLLWFPPFLFYQVDEAYIKGESGGEVIGNLLKIFMQWLTVLDAYFGHIYLHTYVRIGNYPASRPLGQPIPVSDLIISISWVTYFGPELVQYLGREKILSAPAWKIETMPTGGILLLLLPQPLDPDVPEMRLAQWHVMDHLGLKPLKKQ